jgi:nucleoside-diphosphate-sugar epimerase
MTVLVTGASGYLGSAVVDQLRRRHRPYAVLRQRLEALPDAVLWYASVAHCAGALRHRGAPVVWSANVDGTIRLLAALPRPARVVYASSRAVGALDGDVYARAKREAERVIFRRPGPSRLLRFTALVGPSPVGVGRSFIARMVRSALLERRIHIPEENRVVDLLDIRDAAAVIAELSSAMFRGSQTIDATSGWVALSDLAELVASQARLAHGHHVEILRVPIPESRHPSPRPSDAWQDLLRAVNVTATPLEETIRATVAAAECQEARDA